MFLCSTTYCIELIKVGSGVSENRTMLVYASTQFDAWFAANFYMQSMSINGYVVDGILPIVCPVEKHFDYVVRI